MNLFILNDTNHAANARFHCDKHAVKMVLEQLQLLCTAHHMAPNQANFAMLSQYLYKKTHYNNPCAKWCRENTANYNWLINSTKALIAEYKFRYKRASYKGESLLKMLAENMPNIPQAVTITPFPQAMPEKYQQSSSMQAYRDYYQWDKARIAKWKTGIPSWFEPVIGSPHALRQGLYIKPGQLIMATHSLYDRFEPAKLRVYRFICFIGHAIFVQDYEGNTKAIYADVLYFEKARRKKT